MSLAASRLMLTRPHNIPSVSVNSPNELLSQTGYAIAGRGLMAPSSKLLTSRRRRPRLVTDASGRPLRRTRALTSQETLPEMASISSRPCLAFRSALVAAPLLATPLARP